MQNEVTMRKVCALVLSLLLGGMLPADTGKTSAVPCRDYLSDAGFVARFREGAVANVVNFVRGLDPRTSRGELKKTLAEEVKLNRQYGFRNTILLQYDAMLDDELVATARASEADKTEYGVWFELCKPLVERAGVEWKCSKPGWQWDWHIDPGFLMAYAPEERRRIIDEVFAKFKSIFGRYPTVAGSWLIDAFSMDYMARQYGMDGFCICREQDSTDAYGLRGGYSNGAYYPSRKNMLSAATDMANAIPVPVFKMLTPDPIYNYSRPQHLYRDYPDRRGCPTLEPVWLPGFTPSAVDWYFRIFCEAPGLANLSYMQLGQENSFGWHEVSKGLPYQMKKLAEAVRDGRLALETFGETARRFKREHARNCPQTQVALDDWTGKDRKSVWYNCANYRANLFWDDGRLVLRDLHVMRDDFAETYLEKPCKSWRALYYTPPVFDQILAVSNACFRPLAFRGVYRDLRVGGDGKRVLTVEAVREDGDVSRLTFCEASLELENVDCDWTRFPAEVLNLTFEGYSYAVRCRVCQENRRLRFDLQPQEP